MKWPEDKAEDGGLTVWSTADADTKWFSPSESSFMINYRVDNLDELLDQLKQNGVEIVSGPESHENGKFAHIRLYAVGFSGIDNPNLSLAIFRP